MRGILWGLGASLVLLAPSATLELAAGASFTLPSHGAVWLNFVVGSPIAEEAFFRLSVYGWLRRRHSPWVAAVVSSILFALFHLPAWWVGGESLVPAAKIATMFAYGLGFAGLYQVSRSICAPIVAHVLNNLVWLSIA